MLMVATLSASGFSNFKQFAEEWPEFGLIMKMRLIGYRVDAFALPGFGGINIPGVLSSPRFGLQKWVEMSGMNGKSRKPYSTVISETQGSYFLLS